MFEMEHNYGTSDRMAAAKSKNVTKPSPIESSSKNASLARCWLNKGACFCKTLRNDCDVKNSLLGMPTKFPTHVLVHYSK